MVEDLQGALDLSFVVIGYNEGATLGACLASVRCADLDGVCHELLYVDGGSRDGSRDIAAEAGVDRQLGGERQRRAAENRNLGLTEARGRYVQFVDGDMVLDPGWPKAAMAVLDTQEDVGVVFGVLREKNQGVCYRALQLDWEYPEGSALYCGGAAMFRRDALEELGGFPEDVLYGEEPYLCWRLRNELGRRVYHLHHPMAGHDLAYQGFGDYWRRNVRCGETYAEIAARCRDTQDPFWSPELRQNLFWGAFILLMFVALAAAPAVAWLTGLGGNATLVWVAAVAGIGLIILARKAVQYLRGGKGVIVSLLYAAHTYLSKLGIAYGIARWRLRRWRTGWR